jgi:hypothetical protein
MAEKKKVLSATVGEDVYAALKRAADGERLTVSSMTDRILHDWLTSHGFLKNSAKVGK